MADEYREYLFEDFIKMINIRVDAVGARQLISALPVFVKETENFRQRFTVTVFRDAGGLKFTMFLGDGNIMGETMNQEKFSFIVGKYLIANILNESIMSHIPPEDLSNAMRNSNAVNNMIGGMSGMPPMGM